MKNFTRYLLTLSLLFSSTALLAQSGSPAGTVHVLKGRATVLSASGDIREIRKGSRVYANETVSTASGSYTRLKLRDDSWIMLRPGSRFYLEDMQFDEASGEGKGFFSLLKGGFRAVTGLIRDKLDYRYSTSVATIGIRGTDFMVRVCNGDCTDIYPAPADGLYLEVIADDVVINNAQGEQSFQAGQYIYIANNAALPQLLTFRPDVFVQSPIPVADPADCIQ